MLKYTYCYLLFFFFFGLSLVSNVFDFASLHVQQSHPCVSVPLYTYPLQVHHVLFCDKLSIHCRLLLPIWFVELVHRIQIKSGMVPFSNSVWERYCTIWRPMMLMKLMMIFIVRLIYYYKIRNKLLWLRTIHVIYVIHHPFVQNFCFTL